MISKDPNKVVYQYLSASSMLTTGKNYQDIPLKEILNNHVSTYNHMLVKHQVVEFTLDTKDYIPKMFIAEVGDDFYLITNINGEFFYSNGVKFEHDEYARCFFVKRNIRYLEPTTVTNSLIKRTPKISIFLLSLVLFVMASPVYSNLFNSRLVFGESVSSLFFVSSIFVFVFFIEYVMKKVIMTKLNDRIEIENKISEDFFFHFISHSRSKDAIIHWKTATESVNMIWKNIGHILFDAITASVIMIVLSFLLGVYAVFPIIIYGLFFIISIRLKLRSYRDILSQNQLADQKLTYLIGMNRSKAFFKFLDFEMVRGRWSALTDELSSFNQKILDHEETSSGILKLYTSTSIVIIFIAAYFAIKTGDFNSASVISLMLLNGRCSGSISSLSSRLYQVIVNHSKMSGAVKALHEEDLTLKEKGKINFDSTSNHLWVSRLSKSYEGREVFTDLSFELNSGDTMCVVGQAGCGKSSLLRVLAGLIYPDSGRVHLNKIDIMEYSEDFYNRNLAFYCQEDSFISDSLFFNMELKFGVNNSKIIEHLKNFGCDYVLNQEYLYQESADSLPISTGQRQKLLMVRAIGESPSIIIMDEPCSCLSPKEAVKFMTMLKSRFPNSIMIFTTHNPTLMQLATSVLDMERKTFRKNTKKKESSNIAITNNKPNLRSSVVIS